VQGQHPEQRQGRLVLVGLGVHPQLLEYGGGVRDVGRQQVNTGGVAVSRPTYGLAVQRDGVPAVVADAAEDPAAQDLLQSGAVEASEELAQTALGGGLAAGETEGVRQGGPWSRPNWARASRLFMPAKMATAVRERMAVRGWRRPLRERGGTFSRKLQHERTVWGGLSWRAVGQQLID
jgi:hypothetical protein